MTLLIEYLQLEKYCTRRKFSAIFDSKNMGGNRNGKPTYRSD